MSDTSLPPVPGTNHIDLSSMPYMPLMIEDFLRSKTVNSLRSIYSINNIALCCTAFRTTPAGSVTDDDDELMIASGFRGSLEEFREAKPIITRGFVKHEDNRLYHPYVIRKAVEVWEANTKHRELHANRTRAANEARRRNAAARRGEQLGMEAEADVCDNQPDRPDVHVPVNPPAPEQHQHRPEPVREPMPAAAFQAAPVPEYRAPIEENQPVSQSVMADNVAECDNDRNNDLIETITKQKKESPLTPQGGQDREAGLFGSETAVPAEPVNAPKPRSRRKKFNPEDDHVQTLWSVFKTCYPQRKGNMNWAKALAYFVENLNAGVPAQAMIKGAQDYHANMVEDGKVSAQESPDIIRTEFVMMPSGFLNPRNRLWEEATEDRTQRKILAEKIRKSGGTVTSINGQRRGGGNGNGNGFVRPDLPSRPSYRGPYA